MHSEEQHTFCNSKEGALDAPRLQPVPPPYLHAMLLLTAPSTHIHTQGEDLDELLHLLCKLTGRLQLEPLLALAEQLAACAARAGLEVAASAGMPLPPPLAGRGAGEGGTSFSPRSASRG